MSVTSSATASRDWEVPSPESFWNRVLLVTITQGDGTPLDASFRSEEDIIEICVGWAHIHPLGVLWYSVTESVVFHQNIEDLNCTLRTLPNMTEFHNEAITVQTMALAEAHITAFIEMWHSNPTTGDRGPCTPPQQSPLCKETLRHLYAQLWDLDDSELRQLVQDLSQEISQRGLTVPPSNPPPHDWTCPSDSQEPKEDDWEVTFPGGGRWGPERQTTPVLSSPAGGRVPSGPPQQLPGSCTGRTRYGATQCCPDFGFAYRHPENKHLQWQCGTRQNQGVVQTVEPWGAVHQGCNFESQLVADLCELMGVQKIWTTLYHPQTNGQCERFNSTLINMLGTLPKEKKSEWKNHIGTLVHAYNYTHNSATGFSPYYLMFGRQPHLLIDVTLGLAPRTTMEPSTTKFVQKLREWNRWAHEKAEAFQAKEAKRHKHSYDKKVKLRPWKSETQS